MPVNHAWCEAARPWRKIEVRSPRSWLFLLEEIGRRCYRRKKIPLARSTNPSLRQPSCTGCLDKERNSMQRQNESSWSPSCRSSVASTALCCHPPRRLRKDSIVLHSQVVRPLCTPPFQVGLPSDISPSSQPPTLRVIESATSSLSVLGGGINACVAAGATGWVARLGGISLRRDLERDRHGSALELLADANGDVNSGVGWHARNMEVSTTGAVLCRAMNFFW
ncbi:hypothetical protein EDB86DRAFT_2894506 [Lactarius hatsudake]|nr:hypothetical protein EDB86DRAFT_2894506 [Lactarius hatsudake]